MATKLCCYKDCNSYSIQGAVKNVTLYRFPKDPHRSHQWMKLSGCDDRIPAHERYLCSKHFDSKYIAVNNRRSVLIGTAIPFVYANNISKRIDSTEEDETASFDDFRSIDSIVEDEAPVPYFEIETEEHGNDNDETLAPIIISEVISQFDGDDEFYNSTVVRDDTISSTEATYYLKDKNNLNKKRNFDEKLSTSEAKRIHLKNGISLIESLEDKSQKQAEQIYIDEPGTEDDGSSETDVRKSRYSTFIFKGEEYVQMPKADYVHEKRKLLEKIKLYEQVFDDIKKSVGKINTH